jgi:hypothetical protein
MATVDGPGKTYRLGGLRRPVPRLAASPEKAGVGGSIPSLAIIYNQQLSKECRSNSPRPFLLLACKRLKILNQRCSRIVPAK